MPSLPYTFWFTYGCDADLPGLWENSANFSSMSSGIVESEGCFLHWVLLLACLMCELAHLHRSPVSASQKCWMQIVFALVKLKMLGRRYCTTFLSPQMLSQNYSIVNSLSIGKFLLTKSSCLKANFLLQRICCKKSSVQFLKLGRNKLTSQA